MSESPDPPPRGASPSSRRGGPPPRTGPGHQAPRTHRTRRTAATVLLVVAAILTPLATVAAWASAEVGVTDRYMATVGPLAHDPDVQQAVADRTTDAVMDHLISEGLIDELLPEDSSFLEDLLGSVRDRISAGVRAGVQVASEAYVGSDAFPPVWEEVNRAAHEAVDRALRGEGDEPITLDLAPVVSRVKDRLVTQGLPIAAQIPELHAQITVAEGDEVRELRPWFRVLEPAGWALPVALVVLLAAGVLVAVRRRGAVVGASLGLVAGAVALVVTVAVFRGQYLDRVPPDLSRAAAAAIYDRFTQVLRDTGRALMVAGVLVAVAAWLTGPRRPGRRAATAGTSPRPVAAVVVGVVVVAVAAYLVWGRSTLWAAPVTVACAAAALAAVTILLPGRLHRAG